MAKLKQVPNGEIYTSESETQRVCVRWFRTIYSQIAKYLFSIPNGAKMGGKKSKTGFAIQAQIMVGEGMTSGVADLMLAIPASGLHGLFIEMKTPVGVWEIEQKAFAERQIKVGYGYVICRSLDQFERAVKLYLTNEYVQIPFAQIK